MNINEARVIIGELKNSLQSKDAEIKKLKERYDGDVRNIEAEITRIQRMASIVSQANTIENINKKDRALYNMSDALGALRTKIIKQELKKGE